MPVHQNASINIFDDGVHLHASVKVFRAYDSGPKGHRPIFATRATLARPQSMSPSAWLAEVLEQLQRQ